jgi:hypothetical protein
MALDFTTGVLDSRVTITRALNTATRVNSSGLIELVNANLPRFDYDPVTLAPKGLLIEEARTNTLLYSAQLDTIPWENSIAGTGVAPTVTADAGVAPDGTSTADRLQFSLAGGTASGDLTRRRQPYVTPAGAHTFSIYLRSNDGVSSYNMHITDAAGATNNITVTGSWQRFTVTATSVGTIIYYSVGLRGGQALVNSNTADILAWGAQVEAGSFATSYIPTTTLPVLRNNDIVSMTGTNFSSWYNASEGAFVVKHNGVSGSYAFAVNDGTGSNYLGVVLQTTTSIRNVLVVGAAFQFVTNTVTSIASVNKTSFSYKTNSVAAASNGGSVATNNSIVLPTVDRLFLGSFGSFSFLNGCVASLYYYPQRLINAENQAFSK